ncbi:hypothetical protein [Streptomyces echinatus]|uniref:Uncharacterized protein n=1 Tax=Streptomyces echinatus TaxID=67293 RepID=A0A7W9UPK3_9ACTN|nr:hypothetical protein [Streptomyces echinatus]MBB5926445.1 hypothetical protein [Streptomyces echinatus]
MSDAEVQHHRARRGQDDVLGLHIPVPVLLAEWRGGHQDELTP